MAHGLELVKVHSAFTYWVEAFLKPYVEHNLKKREEAKDEGNKFGDMFYKLANNAVYGKTFEKV